MNILSFNSFKFNPQFRSNEPQIPTATTPKFGLKMAQPLSKDTVSFGASKNVKKIVQAAQQTNKVAGSRKDAISLQLSRMIRKSMQEPHEKLEKHLLGLFDDQVLLMRSGKRVGEMPKKHLFTLDGRIKSEDSIIQKTASRGWGNLGKKELLANMTDVSGFCFIFDI